MHYHILNIWITNGTLESMHTIIENWWHEWPGGQKFFLKEQQYPSVDISLHSSSAVYRQTFGVWTSEIYNVFIMSRIVLKVDRYMIRVLGRAVCINVVHCAWASIFRLWDTDTCNVQWKPSTMLQYGRMHRSLSFTNFLFSSKHRLLSRNHERSEHWIYHGTTVNLLALKVASKPKSLK